ncbi:NUDIX domain-containing protein [Paenibacillus allorhizosphaerae]|uniref:Nudix hydrolase domain-containing protein n=1 Tax=Paenibacillus allorhizosphaerae TaxID=2849866 RepID=A0ABM8VHL9_9BACL|nr:NUDIX domain-containing protein [Paenibacillus allorhizosphaerae]CAG7642400.1 hypothetical protein PAECIP111802_02854 [Paenibacillus allorhizosphaerae]
MEKTAIVKVTAYITRQMNGVKQLLVFEENGFEHLGFQVPGGTVESGEGLEEALIRELSEEAGITPHDIKPLGEYCYISEVNRAETRRYYFEAKADCAEQFTHIVQSNDEDNGWIYNYRWTDLHPSLKLHGYLGRMLHTIQ